MTASGLNRPGASQGARGKRLGNPKTVPRLAACKFGQYGDGRSSLAEGLATDPRNLRKRRQISTRHCTGIGCARCPTARGGEWSAVQVSAASTEVTTGLSANELFRASAGDIAHAAILVPRRTIIGPKDPAWARDGYDVSSLP
jgi:hypothetical protein